jgi:3-oxoacyl-[acyl-carrier-protein] synthase-3
VTNKDLEAVVDTTADWIETRTGILERRHADPDQTTSTMCVSAARQALERSQLAARELDLILCATTTPDHLLPATAALVQERIGAVNAGAFDINSACTGFMNALIAGAQYIQTGTCRRVLVTAGETLSRFINWQDRTTCVLFGDGAGAVILEATHHTCGILGPVVGCRGDVTGMLSIRAGGSAEPCSAEAIAAGDHFIRMRGKDIFKMAVRTMNEVSRESLLRTGIPASALRKVIAHQANLRIMASLQESLDLATEKMYYNVGRYGNTGSASIAIALAEFLDTEDVRPGDHLLLVAFGGGMTWASAILQFPDVAAILKDRARPLAGSPTLEPGIAGQLMPRRMSA